MRRGKPRVRYLRFGGSWGSFNLCLHRLLGSNLLLHRLLGSDWCLGIATVRGGPEGEVVAEELHNECAVTVRLLGQRIELSNSIVECLLGKMTCTVWGVEDFVVEDREVKGESETDGVGWGELGLGDISCVLGDS